ncbi:hypothetical protein PVIIG_05912 [Plasmodium vivax India VII]|uniref:Variable surface protein Vir7-like protein n=1 Tax=Plasmodium vivax India VII TaxID=1077284 RepID=A0A0J9S356_PLAVI|nr:hypothetical protein PVIIG_05912 [Plasmodium vivax India VII]
MVTAYNEFNETVTEEQRSLIKSLMDNLTGSGEYNHKHKDIYEKVMRNLSLLLSKTHTKTQFSDYCTYLYQWLYLTKKKNNVSDYMVGVIYPASQQKFDIHRGKYQCPYYTYDKNYDDPIKIIKLQNFYNNIDTIADALMYKSLPQKKDSHYCYAQSFANECVKIYRNMLNIYCSDKKDENENTCSELNTFYKSYTQFLFIKDDIKNKIPDIDSGEDEKFYGCPADKPSASQELKQESGPTLGMGTVSYQGQGSISDGDVQTDNPIPFNTTSVVSAMAGIPPFLALIYKVIIICT